MYKATPIVQVETINDGYISGSNATIELTLIEPSPLELRCRASGTPTPILSWTLNGHTLVSTARIHNHLLTSEHQLASSESGSVNVIFINEHGHIVNGSSSVENSTATGLSQSHRHRGRLQQMRTADGGVLGTLSISMDATEKKVSGNYVCSAINAVGRDEAVLQASVLGKIYLCKY